MKNLEKLAEIVGISVVDFKLALNVPLALCVAATSEEAWEEYNNAAQWSETEVAAIMRCMDFCRTVAQAKKAYEQVASGSEAERVVLAKWNELSLAKIAAAKTLEQAISAYEGCPTTGDAKTAALRKIHELFEE